MPIRNYRQSDWPEMLRLYNLALIHDQVDELFFVQYLLLNPNFDPQAVFILEREDRIVGWTLAMIVRHELDCWGDITERTAGRGYIMLPAALELEDTMTLIAAAEEYIRSAGCKVSCCSTPGYTLFPNGISEDDYPMLHEAFVRAGYTIAGYSHSMQRSLEGYTMPDEYRERLAELAGQGIIIKTGDVYDLVPLRKMFENSTMRNWLHLVCRKAEQNKLHEMIVVRQGDEAIGYCQYNYFGTIDRAGPFGMTEAMRGKGVGTVMIAKLFEVMSQQKIKRAWFASCVKERINFYQKNGLQVFRKKSIFSKEL